MNGPIGFLIREFEAHAGRTAFISKDFECNYGQLIEKIEEGRDYLQQHDVRPGQVVSLEGDFTPNSIALMLALIQNSNIIVPFNSPTKESERIKGQIAQVEKVIIVNPTTDQVSRRELNNRSDHPLYSIVREGNNPGLVLFTSGTSGEPKGAVHDFSRLLKKFQIKRNAFRTVNFLLFDHWGGLNTMFHTISNCGTVLATRDRRPEAVCEFVEKHKIELLPVSPSFLNLLILSEVHRDYDLSSLKLITYGAEPMPESTLRRAREIFSNVSFQQTYGLIESGVLRSRSKSDDSLWVKIGGEGYELRVVDNILQIKADSAMLGYLNAPSPFTDDGYFITGDHVLVDGDYMRILGRDSEIINVGGEKVYPQEVENLILRFRNVLDVTVYGEKNAIVGNIVCARIALKHAEDVENFVRELKHYCRDTMPKYKVPMKIRIESDPLHNERFKKTRQL